MKSELKQSWIAALRSGNYKQGKDVLRDKKNRCCCIGVLCDLIQPEAWTRGPSSHSTWYFQGECNMAPFDWLGKLGIGEARARQLAEANDSGDNFEEIADYIDRNL